MRKILAFTLAETLIVMGIIGIVSALTLPNLNSSTGEKEKVAKVKKIYRDLTDAIGRAIAVYGPIDDWLINDSNSMQYDTRIGERLTEFIKVSKTCGYGSAAENMACFPNLSSGAFNSPLMAGYKFITADGTNIVIATGYDKFWVGFDIDGKSKGKNTYGTDVFVLKFDINGNLQYDGITSFSGDFVKSDNVYAYWILKNDNLDYLKLDSSGKCPNGSKLNWDNNISCK